MSPQPSQVTEEALEENKEIIIRAVHWTGEEGLEKLKAWLYEEFRKEDAQSTYMRTGEQYLTTDSAGYYELGAKHSRSPYAFEETHVCKVYWPDDKGAKIMELYATPKSKVDGSIVMSAGATESTAMTAADTV